MGAVFALASAMVDITTARLDAVAAGMRITLAVAAMLIVVALAIAIGSRAIATRPSLERCRTRARHRRSNASLKLSLAAELNAYPGPLHASNSRRSLTSRPGSARKLTVFAHDL
jgi:hypothetical protein